MESYDLVVVGAGINGLIVGKTYVQLHPDASVAILDDSSTLGGSWCQERLYPDLKTNNLHGSFEFSDFPMTGYGLDSSQHISGAIVNRYLNDFATGFDLHRLIQLETVVVGANYRGRDGWILQLSHRKQFNREILTKKLVVATGLTSDPQLPKIKGLTEFGKPFFHAKDWAQRAEEVERAKTVAVLGGSKSAMDIASSNATRGADVHWIIRKSGHGPGWTSTTKVTPFNVRRDSLLTVRFMTLFSPCIWAVDGYKWFRQWLQKTWLGKKFVLGFFSNMESDLITKIGYDKHPETRKLKPWSNLFWHAADVSVLNYREDIMEQVRNGQIKVHIADVDHLSSGAIHLSDGEVVSTDLIVCGTGWTFRPPIAFTGVSVRDLGLPHNEGQDDRMIQELDEDIFHDFPLLRCPPKQRAQTAPGTVSDPQEPYRLYRFTVPPRLIEGRNIAFAGAFHNITTCSIAQAQALWITAYFDGKIKSLQMPSDAASRDKAVERLVHETFLHTQFSKRCSPMAFGSRHPDFSLDSLAFTDLLLKDLGLQIWRKKNWFWELFESYGPRDHQGLVDEWVELQRG